MSSTPASILDPCLKVGLIYPAHPGALYRDATFRCIEVKCLDGGSSAFPNMPFYQA